MTPLKMLPLLALLGCTSIVPATVLQLNALSPLEADPAGFAVKLTLPDGIDITPNTAVLTLSGQQTPTSEPLVGAFTLVRAGDVFRVNPSDLQAMRDLQATYRAWEEADSDAASGSLGITLTPCTRGAGPAADARASVAIQITEGGAFLPLVRNGPLSAVTDEDIIGELPRCP